MASGVPHFKFHWQTTLQLACWAGIVCLALPGCTVLHDLKSREDDEKKVAYLGNKPFKEHLTSATSIEHPILESGPEDVRDMPFAPRTIKERLDAETPWDITLAECIQLSLTNNKIVRRNDRSSLQGNQSRILSAGDQNNSIYDVAIQETGVLFGGRGIESSLSAFDPQWTTRMNWGKTEVVQNNLFGGGGLAAGSTLVNDVGSFSSGLSKQFATGGSVSVSHSVDYTQNNVPTALFPSSYAGNIRADLRQPLWAGAGVEYTRIAGPVSGNIQGLSGVNQGVAISRINNDITIADFESSVTDMVFDVEKLYWDLYLAYRRYSASIKARESALKTWQDIKLKLDIGAKGGVKFEEAQARTAYFERMATEEASLAAIDSLEGSLRRMIGLSLNDGRILRPVDEPITAEFKPDWTSDLALALTKRVELRRQKWNIKSTELQLTAAKSLTNPRLDLVGNYQVNGFGDRLMSDYTEDGLTNEGYHNFYDAMLRGNQTSYTAGVEMSVALGFRAAHAQVRNLELRLAKSREVLRVQEHDITYELAQAYQDMVTNWSNSQNYFNRRLSAEEQTQALELIIKNGAENATLRDLLEAQANMAQAEAAYFQTVVEYTKSIAHINYRKGMILEANNIYLTENNWNPEAYRDALRRAWSRSYGLQPQILDKVMDTYPAPFSTKTEVGPPHSYAVPEGVVPQMVAPSELPGQNPRFAPGVDAPPPPAPPVDDEIPPPPPEDNAPRLLPPAAEARAGRATLN